MRKSNQGFTLIELIMVIVILGVLAAFALPRFANFSVDARKAALQGVAGGMKSAAAISHAQWLISSGSLATTDVTLDGTQIGLWEGYPASEGLTTAVPPITTIGIIEAIGGSAGLGQITELVTPAPVPRVDGVSAGRRSWGFSSTCYITYTEALAVGTVVTPYDVTVEDGAC